ncbi:MAG: hypothetical protein ACHREM_20380 [Polyangiales bacterium]
MSHPAHPPPTDEEVLDRAASLINEAVYTVALQRRRLGSSEPEDENFVMRPWADMQFLIIALRRVRRAAELAKRVGEVRAEIEQAIVAFDAAVPSLPLMRNVGEHIDAYSADAPQRHVTSVSRSEIAVGSWSPDEFNWLGHRLDIAAGMLAAEALRDVVFKAHRIVAQGMKRGS